MNNHFQHILVPVDFSINTDLAVKKAIELSDQDTTVHLLNVQLELTASLSARTYGTMIGTDVVEEMDYAEEKLEQWRWAVEESSGLKVRSHVVFDASVQSGILRQAEEIQPDLIIVGKHSHHSWFPFLNTVVPSELSEKSGVPVLTLKPGSLDSKTRKVIIPVNDNFPENKMEMIRLLSRKYRLEVFLVTFMDENKPSAFNSVSLLHAFQWLRQELHCPLEYGVLHGTNKAKELLRYADQIEADMLLLHPGKETTVGWMKRQISDLLPPDSRVQVLAVNHTNSLTTNKAS
jgi:nucleotide-binding universal stress UspA family protein